MADAPKTDPSDRLNPGTVGGDHDPGAMITVNELGPESREHTAPDEIAGLGVDAQAMYQRVCHGLGLPSPQALCIGRYRIKSKLGEGGMGVVYLAHDPKLEREVAIKIVSARPFANAEKLRARLLREAQLLAKLRHPHVVTVHDTGEHAGEVFLAMEYVAGQTLRDWQQIPGRYANELLRTYVAAGRGLAAAHKEGIVHRDFKPDNVFVSEDGHASVGDFGLANLPAATGVLLADAADSSSKSARMTQTGELLGTLGYMAPEQLRGDEVDARTDQYAYCVSLWEAMAGAKPFEGATRDELLEAMRNGQLRGAERLPAWLRRALRIGLSLSPDARHPSMVELLVALERGLGRGDRWKLGGAFGLAALISLASLITMWTAREPGPEEPDCPLVEEIDAIEQSQKWQQFHDQLSLWNQIAFTRRLDVLRRSALAACLNDSVRHTQAIERWLEHAADAVENAPELTDAERSAILAELDREYVASPPPVALSSDVNALLKEMTKLYDESRFSEIIAKSTAAIEEVESDLDEAELRLHRGRGYLFQGDYGAALEDFRLAEKLADGAHHDDARLRAYLLAAKTAAMRLEDLDSVRLYLSHAEGVFVRLDEPVLSRRRADYLEIAAAFEMRQEGGLDHAARMQQLVVFYYFLTGSTSEEATALTNLGMIEEYRGDLEAGERCYRSALQLAPDDPQPTLNLARLLVNRGEEQDMVEARRLLASVLASEHRDLHVLAHTALLQLELQLGDSTVIASRRDGLVALLQSDQTATPTHHDEAWAFVVLAYAALGDFGSGFDAALAQLDGASTEFRGLVELQAATAAAAHPAIARELAARALARFESLPDSEATRQLISDARALHEELD